MANKSAMPVKWHKECLKNQMASLTRLILERDHAMKRFEHEIHKGTNDVQQLAEQIARAEAEGKTSFDADKYNIKKSQ